VAIDDPAPHSPFVPPLCQRAPSHVSMNSCFIPFDEVMFHTPTRTRSWHLELFARPSSAAFLRARLRGGLQRRMFPPPPLPARFPYKASLFFSQTKTIPQIFVSPRAGARAPIPTGVTLPLCHRRVRVFPHDRAVHYSHPPSGKEPLPGQCSVRIIHTHTHFTSSIQPPCSVR